DSTHRYPMTDAVQPLMVTSANARKPKEDPKANLDRYYMLAHGSHLVDTARYFAGEIVAVDARQSQRGGMRCWFVDVEFANGVLGHLDLTVAVRMDWHEGFQIYGQNGSVIGKTYNPWYYKTSEVDIFHEAEGGSRRVLGAAVAALAAAPRLRERLALGGLAAVRERTWEAALGRLGDGWRAALARAGRAGAAEAA
ncbi:MAG: hypothetical protein ABW060_12390, partial [Solirubrobacteraceae bacterium]